MRCSEGSLNNVNIFIAAEKERICALLYLQAEMYEHINDRTADNNNDDQTHDENQRICLACIENKVHINNYILGVTNKTKSPLSRA